MIVKVQLSQTSSDGKRHVLIYNEDRSVMHQMEADEAIIEKMQGEPKRYFDVKITDDEEIVIGDRVEDQDW